MRVLLADDDPKVCAALELVLEQQPGIVVLGATGFADELMTLAAILQPDLVLLDWELPGPPAHDVLVALRDVLPGVLVLALSSRLEARGAALAAGANAFASKGDPPEVMLAALSAAGHEGQERDAGCT